MKRTESRPNVRSSSAYAQAGVDIDEKMKGLANAKRMIEATATRGVLSKIGAFGGMFAAPGAGRILVASADGVGTKLKVAALANRHDTVGQDLVNHCVNDILVQGARPLFFLDYVGASQLTGKLINAILRGVCKACRANGCALLGGETAELPGLYPPGEYDLVGTIVGVVERRELVTGASIRPGDVIIGLPSTGLQTNGYSLARKVIFEQAGLTVKDRLPGTTKTVADALLAVHGSFLAPITRLRRSVTVRGMAHITGGGFYDNIPRVLSENTLAVVSKAAWTVPPLFRFIQERGGVSEEEMYRVFNMGIGYVAIVRAKDAARALGVLKQGGTRAAIVGMIEAGPRDCLVV